MVLHIYGTYNTDETYITSDLLSRNNLITYGQLQYGKSSNSPTFYAFKFSGVTHTRYRSLYNTNKTVYNSNNCIIYDCETDEILADYSSTLTYIGPINMTDTCFYAYSKTNSDKTITIYKVDLDNYSNITQLGTFTSSFVPSKCTVTTGGFNTDGNNKLCTFFMYKNNWNGSYYTNYILSYGFDMVNEHLFKLQDINGANSGSYGSSSGDAEHIITDGTQALIYAITPANNSMGIAVHKYIFNTQTVSTLYTGTSSGHSFDYPNMLNRPIVLYNGYLYCLTYSKRASLSNGETSTITINRYTDGTSSGVGGYDIKRDKLKNVYISNGAYNSGLYKYSSFTINDTTLNVYYTFASVGLFSGINTNLSARTSSLSIDDVIDATDNIFIFDGIKQGKAKYIGLDIANNENYNICFCYASYSTSSKNWANYPSLIGSTLDFTDIDTSTI